MNEEKKKLREQIGDIVMLLTFIFFVLVLAGSIFALGYYTAYEKQHDEMYINRNWENHVNVEKTYLHNGNLCIELTENKPIKILQSSGTSMYPLLYGDSFNFLIIPEDKTDVHIGDVILFKTSKTNILHRIVAVDYDEDGLYYITKGDNNFFIDDYKVRYEHIIGILVGVVF